MEPIEPCTEENHAYDPDSPGHLRDLTTWFVGMITHGDEEMTEAPEEWVDVDPNVKQPIVDLDDFDYDQFLLDYQGSNEEKGKEEDVEPSKQRECYMSVQDPEPPREELEQLVLGCPTPSSRDVTIPDATCETSHEARLCFLHQNDDLDAENNHIRQQLDQSPNTQQIWPVNAHSSGGKNLAPIGRLS